jgi:hypothetical protein
MRSVFRRTLLRRHTEARKAQKLARILSELNAEAGLQRPQAGRRAATMSLSRI